MHGIDRALRFACDRFDRLRNPFPAQILPRSLLSTPCSLCVALGGQHRPKIPATGRNHEDEKNGQQGIETVGDEDRNSR